MEWGMCSASSSEREENILCKSLFSNLGEAPLSQLNFKQ